MKVGMQMWPLRIMRTSILGLLTLLVCLLGNALTGEAKITEEAVFLPTRAGVVQPFLISYDDEVQPEAIAILFSGSAGYVGIKPDQPVTNGNFLVRSRRLFVQNHLATAVIDCPSDHKDGIDISFRISGEHALDIGAVIDEMNKKFPGLPVYLIGTSRGTISAGYAAIKLESKLKGVILTSSVFNEITLPPTGLTVPVLLVHNTADGCSASPYGGAVAASKSGGYPLISVNGGSSASGKAACEPFSPHGYLNMEEPTIAAIADWIFGRPYKTAI